MTTSLQKGDMKQVLEQVTLKVQLTGGAVVALKNIADGTVVTADEDLFTSSFTPPENGIIVVSVAIDGSAAGAVLQQTRNASASSPKWVESYSGMKLKPGAEYTVGYVVTTTDDFNMSFAAATTVASIRGLFTPNVEG